ncbi:hypothetical protein CKL33_001763 [Escherichia coli]|nr:hypothetical protein [Escherichia coli]EEZ9005770.1 hypothetical protein [Escherichia coli O150]EEW4176971.1 hypothetical protein [Escherichia coli]EEW4223370.1 hypothetical protein [Escherichia coli]EEZ1432381.1 hypothetical protein [Escherichia coli]
MPAHEHYEFPAPAGINRRTLPNDSGGGRVPRASGDKPGEYKRWRNES